RKPRHSFPCLETSGPQRSLRGQDGSRPCPSFLSFESNQACCPPTTRRTKPPTFVARKSSLETPFRVWVDSRVGHKSRNQGQAEDPALRSGPGLLAFVPWPI